MPIEENNHFADGGFSIDPNAKEKPLPKPSITNFPNITVKRGNKTNIKGDPIGNFKHVLRPRHVLEQDLLLAARGFHLRWVLGPISNRGHRDHIRDSWNQTVGHSKWDKVTSGNGYSAPHKHYHFGSPALGETEHTKVGNVPQILRNLLKEDYVGRIHSDVLQDVSEPELPIGPVAVALHQHPSD